MIEREQILAVLPERPSKALPLSEVARQLGTRDLRHLQSKLEVLKVARLVLTRGRSEKDRRYYRAPALIPREQRLKRLYRRDRAKLVAVEEAAHRRDEVAVQSEEAVRTWKQTIRAARKAGFTLHEIAQPAGVSYARVSQIVNGADG